MPQVRNGDKGQPRNGELLMVAGLLVATSPVLRSLCLNPDGKHASEPFAVVPKQAPILLGAPLFRPEMEFLCSDTSRP